MGTVANTYLIAAGALLASAVGAEVIRLDIKVAGIIVMTVGVIVFVVGSIGFFVKPAKAFPLRPRMVNATGGTHAFGAIVGQSTVTNDDASQTPLL